MSHIDNQALPRGDSAAKLNQEGFSVIEFLVVMVVMLIVVGAIFSLVRDSTKVAMTTYEMTEAQQNMRTAQEFINRDLMNAGDGLESISNVRVPQGFYASYVSPSPVPSPAGIVNMGIFTTDGNVGALTVTGANPAATLRAGTDRQTILELDPEFAAITPLSIDASGTNITLQTTFSMTKPDATAVFIVGEIYFLSSSQGATFVAITAINGRVLTFANNDPCGLNLTGTGGHIKYISTNGTLATSLQRMRMIQYYVNSTGALMRRVFGVPGSGFRDSIIAEHVVDVQFTYSLIIEDDVGNVTPSTTTTLTPAQQLWVRQVEVKVTVETPHAIQSGSRQQMTMTTSTSVRNMQFRRAL